MWHQSFSPLLLLLFTARILNIRPLFPLKKGKEKSLVMFLRASWIFFFGAIPTRDSLRQHQEFVEKEFVLLSVAWGEFGSLVHMQHTSLGGEVEITMGSLLLPTLYLFSREVVFEGKQTLESNISEFMRGKGRCVLEKVFFCLLWIEQAYSFVFKGVKGKMTPRKKPFSCSFREKRAPCTAT